MPVGVPEPAGEAVWDGVPVGVVVGVPVGLVGGVVTGVVGGVVTGVVGGVVTGVVGGTVVGGCDVGDVDAEGLDAREQAVVCAPVPGPVLSMAPPLPWFGRAGEPGAPPVIAPAPAVCPMPGCGAGGIGAYGTGTDARCPLPWQVADGPGDGATVASHGSPGMGPVTPPGPIPDAKPLD